MPGHRQEVCHDDLHHAGQVDGRGRAQGQGLTRPSRRGKESARGDGGRVQILLHDDGRYDLVAVYEAPDDAVAARFTLQLGMLGNVQTETLKAFPEAAYREIIRSVS